MLVQTTGSDISDKSDAPLVTLITPMYNESEKIQANVRRILDALEDLGVSWEYILVDDGSSDDSLQKARGALANRPQCRVIHYETNRGRGYALRQGFAAARGRYVVTTESDLSWGPEVIGKIHNALRITHADMIIASAHLPGGGLENVPAFRRILSKLGNRVMRWAFGGNLTMISGMTRGYRRQAIQSLLLEEDRKEIHLEIVTKAQAMGFRITEIPATIRWDSPKEGTRRRGGLGILRFVFPHLLVSSQRASVKLFSWCALGAGFLGGLLVVVGTVHKVFRILPYPLPNLVIYGLIFVVMAVVFAMFMLLSIQIRFVYRGMVHLQSQLKQLQNSTEDQSTEPPSTAEKS